MAKNSGVFKVRTSQMQIMHQQSMSCTYGGSSFKMPRLQRDLSRVSKWLMGPGRVPSDRGTPTCPAQGEDRCRLVATRVLFFCRSTRSCRTRGNHPIWVNHSWIAMTWASSKITLWGAKQQEAQRGIHVQQTIGPIHLQGVARQCERVWKARMEHLNHCQPCHACCSAEWQTDLL